MSCHANVAPSPSRTRLRQTQCNEPAKQPGSCVRALIKGESIQELAHSLRDRGIIALDVGTARARLIELPPNCLRCVRKTQQQEENNKGLFLTALGDGRRLGLLVPEYLPISMWTTSEAAGRWTRQVVIQTARHRSERSGLGGPVLGARGDQLGIGRTENISSFDPTLFLGLSCVFEDWHKQPSTQISSFDPALFLGLSYVFEDWQKQSTTQISSFDTALFLGLSYVFEDWQKQPIIQISSFDSALFLDWHKQPSTQISSFDPVLFLGLSYVFKDWQKQPSTQISSFDPILFLDLSYVFED
ncbi:hypothetical protein PR202_ga13658 [Eleusine coracana subsp. coracana]|uniref:DUF7595 domain-containing protein n=1 Tax=Eleusine coracana subsp. coracana TaxID=191504 RepID=A0AAV5CFA1_ELECO|nr:hypothetical protein PR202_ga13658 [Eleusine coracana subsp. coracana]